MKAWWEAARANANFRRAMLIAGIVILLDQATKLYILHVLDLDARFPGRIEISRIFDLTYVENRGVSFGLFSGGMTSRILLTLLALGVAAAIVRWAGRLDRRVAALGAGFIVGGALGNAIDRSFYGYVVDFLDFSGLGFPWKFNIADAAINVGVACLAYDAFIVAPKQENAARAKGDGGAGVSTSLGATEPDQTEGREPFPTGDRVSITPDDDERSRTDTV